MTTTVGADVVPVLKGWAEMNKERVIYITVLFTVFAACFAVYQFYFKAKLEKYAQDKQLLQNLNSTYSGLNSTFRDEDPDTVVAQYRSVVESWKDAINTRITYFNDSEWREHAPLPEDVFILRFWYGDQTREMTLALWEKAQAKFGTQVYQRFPPDVQTMLGVAYAEQWQGYSITRELVTEQLERLSYGISVFEMLLDHNVQQIRQVALYESKPSGFIGPNVEYARVGLSFTMEIKDLIQMFNDMREADSYFSIEGLKVAHQFIAVNYEPQLEVEMFMRRTKPKADLSADTVTTAGGLGLGGLRPGNTDAAFGGNVFQSGNAFGTTIDDEEDQRFTEPSGIAKFWRWFKRTVLFTN